MNEFKSKVIYEKLKKHNVKKVFYENVDYQNSYIYIFFTHRDLLMIITTAVFVEEDVPKSFKEISESIIEDIEFLKEKIDYAIYENLKEISEKTELTTAVAYLLDDQITSYNKMNKNQDFDEGWEVQFGILKQEVYEQIKRGKQPIEIFYSILKKRNYLPQDVLSRAIGEDYKGIGELNIGRALC